MATEANSMIIRTRELAKHFGADVAVSEVTMEVPRARIFGFIGPSGAGKTTTIRMLTGYYPPTSGEVSVLGCAPTQFTRQQRARIGYMPQLFVLYPHLSIWENLNFAASIYGMSLRRKPRLREILEFVELWEHRQKLARDISGGMQRRLSLAATLLHKPQLIFLDEPTASIDPVLRQKFWEHFRELRDAGHTLFVTTQYVSEAAYCDSVGIINEGALLTIDTPEGLRRRAYGGDVVALKLSEPLSHETQSRLLRLPFVHRQAFRHIEGGVRLIVDEAHTAIPKLLNWSQDEGVAVASVEEYHPPYEEVFVQIIQRERSDG